MAEQLQLALLGNPEVRRDGVAIASLSSGKALALLSYLAVTRRPHLRPTLVGLLWGDMPEDRARNNLSKALTELRQAVGPHLDITRQVVALDRQRPYWLDVEAFRGADCGAPHARGPHVGGAGDGAVGARRGAVPGRLARRVLCAAGAGL